MKQFEDIYEESDSQSGNGRMVRNYVESLIRNQSIRIAEEDISVYEMNLITAKDIEKINVLEYEYSIGDRKNRFDLKGFEAHIDMVASIIYEYLFEDDCSPYYNKKKEYIMEKINAVAGDNDNCNYFIK